MDPLTVHEALKNNYQGNVEARDLFAEPPINNKLWFPSVVRRLEAAYRDPVGVGLKSGGLRDRLEAAGWHIISKKADPKAARSAAWPALDQVHQLGIGFGSLAPKLVIVGDRNSHDDQRPFVSLSGAYLFKALRLLGYDEMSCYVTNAHEVNRKARTNKLKSLKEAFDRYSPAWLSLGANSARAMKSAGISAITATHPAWHQKNKGKSEGFKGFADILTGAGLKYGRWHGLDLPAVSCLDLPELPAPYNCRSIAYIPTGDSFIRGGNSVSAKKREEARRLFVTGQAATIQAAAREVKASADELRKFARVEGWVGERDAYERDKTRRLKERIAEAETKAAAASRSLAWSATQQALKSIVERLKDGSYRPTAHEAKALADCAMSLTDRVQAPDEKRSDLQGKTLKDLISEVHAKVEQGLGGGL